MADPTPEFAERMYCARDEATRQRRLAYLFYGAASWRRPFRKLRLWWERFRAKAQESSLSQQCYDMWDWEES